MAERKRTERKNINFAFYKGKRDRKKYLPVFPVLLIWCLMVWYMFISPLRDLAIQKQALTQKQKELAVLLDENKDYEVILSRLVDTFFSRISPTMQLPPKHHSIAYVLPWAEGLHWQSRSSGCSNS